MASFFHKKLPGYSTLLSGQQPRDEYSFHSDRLQIWYNNTERGWQDAAAHYHTDSDEVFIMLKGSIVVEVEGERVTIGPGEYCCFAAGVVHAVVEAHPPIESLMLRDHR
ncbi:MAG: cupin domain-containing protein, partial [Anaerolineae bacterium]|nr:cupin domain-containing protein [Anaerolineae bacterium]